MQKLKKKKKEYVNNEDFMKALMSYKDESKENAKQDLPPPKIPNYIGECFMKIAEGLSHKPNFINYTYRDEMIADGVENCLMYFENFNPEKSKNPFAYFTQVIFFAFLRRIQKEKKQLYVKYKATEQFGILDEYELLELEDGTMLQFDMYDNIAEFIENFEESKRNKKNSTKLKGLEKFIEE
jgi:hypothetical protein